MTGAERSPACARSGEAAARSRTIPQIGRGSWVIPDWYEIEAVLVRAFEAVPARCDEVHQSSLPNATSCVGGC